MKPRLEKEIQIAILKYLTLRKDLIADCWRNNNAAIYDRKREIFRKNPLSKLGIPDICGYLVTGVSLFVEVKRTEKSIRSPEQIAFIEKAVKNNCLAFFTWSMEDCIQKLDRYEVREDVKKPPF